MSKTKAQQARSRTQAEAKRATGRRGAMVLRRHGLGAISLAVLLGTSGIAHALDFEYDGFTGSFDTTLQFGGELRTSGYDTRFIGSNTNGPTNLTTALPAALGGGVPGGNVKPVTGSALVPNHDDGDLNFGRGSLISLLAQATHELQIKKDNYGLFLRGTYFYDFINADKGASEFKPFSNDYRHSVGYDFRLLDAFTYWNGDVADHPLDIRFGNQVINWGEATFIQGVNQFSPLDLTALVTAGAELRQAILPVPAIDFKFHYDNDLSLEAFYQFAQVQDRLFPSGSFFSGGSLVDYILPGGQLGQVGGLFPDNTASAQYPSFAGGLAGIGSGSEAFGAGVPTREPINGNDQGQFGVALRYTAPDLGDAEFGLYFEHFNSRLPIGSIRTGTAQGLSASLQEFIAATPVAQGGGPAAAAALGAALPLVSGGAIPSSPGLAANYLGTSGTFRDYINRVNLIGASTNFVGPLGIAVQSEVTYKPDAPLQLSASDLNGLIGAAATCAAVNPLTIAGVAPLASLLNAQCQSVQNTPTAQLLGFGPGNAPGFGEYIPGYTRRQVLQWQLGLTKLFQDIPGTPVNTWNIIGEFGLIDVLDWPKGGGGVFNSAFATSDQSAFNPLPGAGQPTSLVPGGQYVVPPAVNGQTYYTAARPLAPSSGIATQFSAGYVILVNFDINNWLPFGIDMQPHIAWQHDIAGITPSGAGFPGFQEHAASFTVGVDFSYLNNIKWGAAYTNHLSIGNSTYDYAVDRDFASAYVSYSF